ncbi:DUF1287 domain-containing protein [Kiloniella laminariae]|uniref:DUF1287 domain-containing protein n=1 Tax=Kiloniella laminariae TaxID=454162 RepID=A0ABT4LE98_9PROT|nr:DUF1287 domain-containing protein [Kiloniella laminariae]MCZ4279414.1 DUF1287 domain-containing protein [Kiloniella laminariae]
MSEEALKRTEVFVLYDSSYYRISYPGGDVPQHSGVCSDVVIRSYRGLGIDLQKLVHEDMRTSFSAYPAYWGLTKPDSNIDHRRVPNLRVFFTRHGISLPLSKDPQAYQAGDLVSWNLRPGGSLPHIGIISDEKSTDGVPLVVHNIGRGPELEDMLFDYEITGHYRYGTGDPNP